MPKMKTCRGAHKRFRYTGSGKIRRSKSNHRHILTKKSQKRKRRLRKTDTVHASDERRMKQLMPYGQK